MFPYLDSGANLLIIYFPWVTLHYSFGIIAVLHTSSYYYQVSLIISLTIKLSFLIYFGLVWVNGSAIGFIQPFLLPSLAVCGIQVPQLCS